MGKKEKKEEVKELSPMEKKITKLKEVIKKLEAQK